MFSKDYFCLVAGFREYMLDSDLKHFAPNEIIDEVLEEVDSKDQKAVELLYNYYDCENIISRRWARTAHNPLGRLSAEQIVSELEQPELLPEPLREVIAAYNKPEDADPEVVDVTKRFEISLLEAYYTMCEKAKCSFLKQWAQMDRSLRNIVASVTARNMDMAIGSVVVGDGDVVEHLTRSSAADFGLRGELPWIDAVLAAVNDESNLLEKERKLDLVRWDIAQEAVEFNYFDIDAILSYLVRINIVARWQELDPKRGREMFDKLIGELDSKEIVNKQ